MQILLDTKPKNATIISGFPGFGLVGTIATEFLIKHLNATPIGKIRIEEVPPIIAVHRGEPVEPLGIFYDKKYNLIILHALTSINGLEWKLADLIAKTARDLKAKEIISIEGVGSNELEAQESRAFYLSDTTKIKKTGIEPLKEGIIVGVTGALLLRKDITVTCIFAETHTKLPDSRAAAKIVEVLDKYLGLKVDYKPLLEKAEQFEDQLKTMIARTQHATKAKDEKKLTYFG